MFLAIILFTFIDKIRNIILVIDKSLNLSLC